MVFGLLGLARDGFLLEESHPINCVSLSHHVLADARELGAGHVRASFGLPASRRVDQFVSSRADVRFIGPFLAFLAEKAFPRHSVGVGLGILLFFLIPSYGETSLIEPFHAFCQPSCVALASETGPIAPQFSGDRADFDFLLEGFGPLITVVLLQDGSGLPRESLVRGRSGPVGSEGLEGRAIGLGGEGRLGVEGGAGFGSFNSHFNYTEE